jgi:Yip1 domain
MTTTTGGTASLQDRVIKILTTPKTEWPVIEAESTDVQKLYAGYIAILAAIPAVCSFLGHTMIGLPIIGRTPMPAAFVTMVLTYLAALAGVYISALIIDKLAPTFASAPNFIHALKLVAYSSTAGWVAGVLNLVPMLGILALVALIYQIYLFYLGLPVLMKTPPDKVIPYMVVAAIVMIVVGLCLVFVVSVIAGGAALTSLS